MIVFFKTSPLSYLHQYYKKKGVMVQFIFSFFKNIALLSFYWGFCDDFLPFNVK